MSDSFGSRAQWAPDFGAMALHTDLLPWLKSNVMALGELQRSEQFLADIKGCKGTYCRQEVRNQCDKSVDRTGVVRSARLQKVSSPGFREMIVSKAQAPLHGYDSYIESRSTAFVEPSVTSPVHGKGLIWNSW